eukprot:m.45795 g.45795  ORF g.45795 m.45795 type:complete len:74 (-) comp10694_c0_seq1:12-233(-)
MEPEVPKHFLFTSLRLAKEFAVEERATTFGITRLPITRVAIIIITNLHLKKEEEELKEKKEEVCCCCINGVWI